MLSDTSAQESSRSQSELISIVKIQTAILKALHDFLEEQNFSQILPHTLGNITNQIYQVGEIGSSHIEFEQVKLESDNMVINHQILLGSLQLDRIYSVTSTSKTGLLPSHLDLEYKSHNFEETIMFIEKMLRRIKIDVDKKANEAIQDINCPIPNWKNTFPVMSRHDIELEFGEDWQIEATTEIETPFFISCVEPVFFDALDPDLNGSHYLNFELYFPNQKTPVIRGGQREFQFDPLMDQMNNLGINRFEFRNYLIQTAENRLKPTSGASINMDALIAAFTCK